MHLCPVLPKRYSILRSATPACFGCLCSVPSHNETANYFGDVLLSCLSRFHIYFWFILVSQTVSRIKTSHFDPKEKLRERAVLQVRRLDSAEERFFVQSGSQPLRGWTDHNSIFFPIKHKAIEKVCLDAGRSGGCLESKEDRSQPSIAGFREQLSGPDLRCSVNGRR